MTKHTITVQLNDWTRVVFPASGDTMLVNVEQEPVNRLLNITRRRQTGVAGLPVKTERTQHLLVASMVLEAFEPTEGYVLYAPDSGPTAIRNENGQVVAVRGLIVR